MMWRILRIVLASASHAARTVASLALVMLATAVASACPTCTDGLAQNDPRGESIAAGFYYSILFMMTVPYVVLATFAAFAYLAIRRARAAGVNGLVGVDASPDAQGGNE